MSDWEAGGSDDGLRSVHVFANNASLNEAVQMAIHRARAKYGRSADLTRWHFWVRRKGTLEPVHHFRATSNDRPVQLDG